MASRKAGALISSIPPPCVDCPGRQEGICSSLDTEQLITVGRRSARRQIDAGDELFSQGQTLKSFDNIISGVLQLSRVMANGRQQIVALQFAPDSVGYGICGKSKHSAQATTPSVICSVPNTVITGMIDDAPRLGRRLLDQSLRELDDARDWMLTIGRKNALERVATLLLKIGYRQDNENLGHQPIELILTRSQMADFLGMTIETVSRNLTRLRKAGIIQIRNNRSVVILNPKKLQSASGQVSDDLNET